MNQTYSASEAAELLKVHINTLRRYIKGGLLRAYKLGGNGNSRRHWIIKADDLELFKKGERR